MSEQIKEIRITPDAVKKHAQTPVYAAFLEAIYNSIDADATQIEVAAINQQDAQMDLFDASESLFGIRITDNGTGIKPDKIEPGFLDLEKSWKKGLLRTGKRPFHGARGCGRFKCLAIGANLQWRSVYSDDDGSKKELTVSLKESDPTHLRISGPIDSSDEQIGTVLTITQLKTSLARRVSTPAELRKLSFDILNGLILDLELAPLSVSFFGQEIETESYKEADNTFPFSFLDQEGNSFDGEMRVLIWNSKVDFTDHKHAFLYKSDGSFLTECPSGFPADYRWPAHTLIFKSSGFDKYDWFSTEFNKLYARVEATTKPLVLQYLTSVKRREFSAVLQKVFSDPRYPFKTSPNTPLDIARQTTYNHVLGELVFANTRELAPQKKALGVVLPLLSRLFSGDYVLGESLEKILELNADDSERFNSFVTRIKLSKILAKYAELIRRKTFLSTLSKLVYDESVSAHLAERTQLHKIVAEEVWVFGEGFEESNLLSNDQGIVTLVRSYVKREDLLFDTPENNAEIESIIRQLQADPESCIQKIPDLAMMKKVKNGSGERFLVIELKKPTVKIDLKCRKQALEVFAGISSAKKKGALPIDDKHQWQYCLVSSGMDDRLSNEFTSSGHLEEKEAGNYVIDVWKWSDVIADANRRIDAEMDQLTIDVQEGDCRRLLESYQTRFGISLEPSDITDAES